MHRALSLQSLGRYQEAVHGYDEILLLFHKHGLPASVARCLTNRALSLQSQGRIHEALCGYDEAMLLFQANCFVQQMPVRVIHG